MTIPFEKITYFEGIFPETWKYFLINWGWIMYQKNDT